MRNAFGWPLYEDYDFGAAIVHRNRVYQIRLVQLNSSQLQRLCSVMQDQFPALIHLKLDFAYYGSPAPALPDEFLGGSAPLLQSLILESIPFPALPKLLLTATDLVDLSLWDIPDSGYFSPESIVTGLAVLANLKSLTIRFETPSLPGPESRRLPPLTRAVLPALNRFRFKGVSEYLEDLVARIDAPLLDSISITFFHQLIFDIPRLAQFIRRTTRFQTLNAAHVAFDDYSVQVKTFPPARAINETSGEYSRFRIYCRKSDWQLSSLVQVSTSFFSYTYAMEHFYIDEPEYSSSQWQDDTDNMQWVEFLHQLAAVKNFYVSKEFTRCIALALQQFVGERVVDVLPALESLFLEGLHLSGPVE
jgi:hypothetical protein